MLFVFGRGLPESLSHYFSERAEAAGHKVLFASMGNFVSTEAFAQLAMESADEIKDQQVVVFDSIARSGELTANDIFVADLFLADTLKRYGAGPLWFVNPFGPFARQDQVRDGKFDSVGCEAAARLLSLDYEGITTIELHSEKARDLLAKHFGAPNVSVLDPTAVFVKDLKQFDLDNLIVGSPDKGANARADALAEALGVGRCYVDKKREEVVHTRVVGFKGDVQGANVILVDDMADTCGTVGGAAETFKNNGALSTTFYASHAVLSGPAWNRLGRFLNEGFLDRVRFGGTINRTAEHAAFATQYGQAAGNKVGFVGFEEMLWDHVTNHVANHPSMKIEVA
jgi:ribose-phosphate pyrophosphokinase